MTGGAIGPMEAHFVHEATHTGAFTVGEGDPVGTPLAGARQLVPVLRPDGTLPGVVTRHALTDAAARDGKATVSDAPDAVHTAGGSLFLRAGRQRSRACPVVAST